MNLHETSRGASMTEGTLHLSLRDRSIRLGDRSLRLSAQFFDLCCLLAYERLRGTRSFVTSRDIHRLPRWRQTTPTSIGKEIHRHVKAMKATGIELIESPARGATKLFRLKVPASEVSFDVPLPEVRTYLGLDLVVDVSSDAIEEVVRFSTALAFAEAALERGHLSEVQRALEEAGSVGPRIVRERVQLMLLRARFLERQGKYREALGDAEEASQLCVRSGTDYLTAAQAHIIVGWMARSNRDYSKTKAHYAEAHKVLESSRHFRELGQIARGLGHLARVEGDLVAARCHFLASLEYAYADGRAWDIQATLFNLGLVETERGDAIRDRGTREAVYLGAQRWVERCIEFTEKTGVGRDSGEAEALLSRVLLGLRRPKGAVSWATRALEIARGANNKKSEAAALACLGQALAASGSKADATPKLLAASAIYRELGYESEAQRLAVIAGIG